MLIPKLETDRLVLREHRVADWPAATAMWADPVVVRHIGGRPFSAQETWSKILRYHGLWSLVGFGYWAVEEKATGLFAGEVGFADFKRDMTPLIADVPELGWAFAVEMHGKGYATEALKAVTQWGDGNLIASRTVCIIDPTNAASLRVAEKCGYREVQRTNYAGHPVILLERS